MRSERWQRVREIFQGALELPPGQRQPYLEDRCGDDEALLRLARSLVAADGEAGAFMRGPLAETLAEGSLREPAPEGLEGRSVGPYKILSTLGEGGMSTVFLASRDDRVFRRRVALKVIRRGMESRDTLYRLETERQILASLEHPNIARLYDGGMTEGNLPYFAMELVEGLPIDEYCDLHELSIPQRLSLFRKVCGAVHFAHQNLVVHRDLKPSNILVDPRGEPRLLDFGIAKLLNPARVGGRDEATAAWVRLITPSYASPEQIRGQPVTTASDVYSLGVLLYKLLTGRLPYRLESRDLTQIERTVQDRKPPPPSAVVLSPPEVEPSATAEEIAGARGTTPEGLRRQLAGDLDTVVQKALHGSPSQRYGSAQQLGEDLERYRRGFPVEARPDSLAYRRGKFLRRHRLAMATVALVGLLLAGGSLALLLQSQRIARERDQLREVIAFVKGVFRVSREGEQLTVREAVDRSAVLLDRQLHSQPQVQATLRDTIGTIYLNLGVPAQARPQLERAVELHRRRVGGDGVDLARSLGSLGVALALLGEAGRGEQRAREALDLHRAKVGARHGSLVQPLNDLVTTLCYKGDYEAAAEPAVLALGLARELLGEDRPERANALTNQAFLLGEAGRYAAAVELYREALRLHRHNLGEEHPEVATLSGNLASTYRRMGELDRAEELFHETLELERKLYRGANTNLARTLYNMGSLLRKREKYGEAERSYREARAMVLELYDPGNYSVAATTVGLASSVLAQGRPREASSLLEEGLEHWRESLAAGPYETFLEQAQELLEESRRASGGGK